MEKLIKLLNEFENTDNWENQHQVEFRENKIISKKFGFIQWLVDNDKIKKNYKEGLPAITKNGFLLEGETALLMLLAISDNPISDLISYLK